MADVHAAVRARGYAGIFSWAFTCDASKDGGCVAPTGPAGGMLLFSSLMVHASPPNISPFGRTIVYLSLCHVDNHIRTFNREEWIANMDSTLNFEN